MRRLLVCALLSLVMVGCQEPLTYVGVYDFRANEWAKGPSVVFDFMTIDNYRRGDILLSVRYLPLASGQTTRLFVKTTSDYNVSHVDTVSVVFDRGSGDAVRSQEILVRRDVIWPRRAPHYISIVSDAPLSNVVSLSIEVDNATSRN